MKYLLLSATCLLLLLPGFIYAQDPDPESTEYWKGWSFSFNTGYYHANRYNANFYNGSAGNVNNVGYVLSNKYWRQEINDLLNVSDTFVLQGMPERMGYNPALSLGFSARYSGSGKNFWFIRFNYAKLTCSDYVTIEVDPNTFPTFPDIRLFDIYGVENRMFLDLGFTSYKPINEQIDWFMQFGLNMTNIDVVQHSLRIENKEYSLINIYGGSTYVPGLQLQEYLIEQGGIGFGGFGGGGIRFNVAPGTGLEIGTDIFVSRVNLPGYLAYRPHINLYVRLSMKTAIEAAP